MERFHACQYLRGADLEYGHGYTRVLQLAVPIRLYHNAPSKEIQRGGTMFLVVLVFLMLTSTFSSMVIARIEVTESATNLAQVMFSLCLVFNGYASSFSFLAAVHNSLTQIP